MQTHPRREVGLVQLGGLDMLGEGGAILEPPLAELAHQAVPVDQLGLLLRQPARARSRLLLQRRLDGRRRLVHLVTVRGG